MRKTETFGMEEEKEEAWYKGPIRYIIMIFLLLIIVLWYFPKDVVVLDPEPSRVAKIDEVLQKDFYVGNKTGGSWDDIKIYNPILKQIADRISSIGCEGNKICQAKSIYYFVRDNIKYVSDPLGFEYIESPEEVLYSRSADCDGHSALLASLEENIGIDAQLVFTPGHVFVRIRLPEALKRYKKEDWIYLDATCKQCGFGELPWSLAEKKKDYLEFP